jgi:hypothetical protein
VARLDSLYRALHLFILPIYEGVAEAAAIILSPERKGSAAMVSGSFSGRKQQIFTGELLVVRSFRSRRNCRVLPGDEFDDLSLHLKKEHCYVCFGKKIASRPSRNCDLG